MGSGLLAAAATLLALVGAAPPVGPVAPAGVPGAAVGVRGAAVGVPAAGRRLVPEATGAAGFRWPVDGAPLVTRRFDPPPRPWQPGHRGVDLAVAPGAVIRSAGPGTVAFAGQVAGRPVLTVRHGDGLRTTYEPVDPLVRPGDDVPAGAPIGRLRPGHPGCARAACLHWGLRRGDTYLDPLSLLGLGRVRLLPT
ncbi:murein hydrolase activator EnvC [Plantactinospora sp. KBS50]|uniref:murein hydrolase activator EnvC family protein n=1 Tax=Plantactinospora sp. KBS50 TaxID=2024580 RepID=UPI000BAAEDA1|nr:M23 family metallopeptidase [Plantactinospora sp. KBS50]ASW57503.1 peptidase M23 [Plantactinospora sp. KBS50]